MAGWIPGLGENRPQPRKLDMSFFGYVPDDGSVDIFMKQGGKAPPKNHQMEDTSDAGSVRDGDSNAAKSDTKDIQEIEVVCGEGSENRLVIKNGKIVNAHGIIEGDIYIEDGVIKNVGGNIAVPDGATEIDAQGKYVMPGGVDPHTRFEFEFGDVKSVDDFHQGTKAAVAGGTTTIINLAIPKKEESLLEAYEKYRKLADDNVCCDYGLHVGVTWWSDKVKEEMEELCKNHGVSSFKLFMAYRNLFMLDDCDMFEVLQRCKQLGAVAHIHAENGSIISQKEKRLLEEGITGPQGHQLSRPEAIEAEAVNRACVIASQVNSPICVHVTSKSSADIISSMRRKGVVVFGEVLASSLGVECDQRLNTEAYVTSPPLRSDPTTAAYLINMLAKDSLQTVGSDNCTFSLEQKAVGKSDFTKIPHGVNGVEDRMSVVWDKGVQTGVIDPQRFVAITSANAAKIYNLYPKKGCIDVGSDADIVVWDPAKMRVISAKTHNQSVDYNIFEGMECYGVPEYVIVNGQVCVDQGELKSIKGIGKFIPSSTNAEWVYNKVKKVEGLHSQMILPVTREMGQLILEDGKRTSLEPKSTDEAPLSPALSTCSSTKYPRNLHESTFSISVEREADKAVLGEGKISFLEPKVSQEAPISPALSTCSSTKFQRNLHESTFSISEELDDTARKSCVRVKSPPGGQSSGAFW